MKKTKSLIIVLVILLAPCLVFLGMAIKPVYVTDITKAGNNTYTVTYSNGEKSSITTTGEDGKDGEDLSLEQIKAYCTANGLDFYEFLQNNFGVSSNPNKFATTVGLKSAVSIYAEFPIMSYGEKDTSVSCGAGIIYKMNNDYSYIITNYHVVYYSNSRTTNKISNRINLFQYGTFQKAYKTNSYFNGYPVIEYSAGAVSCEYVGGALNYDIAILKVSTQDLLEVNPDVRAVDIASGYHIADTAIAIGNPESQGISVTEGVISVISEDIKMKGADNVTNCEFRVMRIDTAINGGNSGGGLFNVYGELIGIVNAKCIKENIQNIAYAIPVDNVTKVADNIIYYHELTNSISQVKKFSFDLTVIAMNPRAIYENGNVYLKDDITVESINESSPAQSLDLELGDIINSITIKRGNTHNTIEFTRIYEFTESSLLIHSGDIISLNITRAGSTFNTIEYTVDSTNLKTIA